MAHALAVSGWAARNEQYEHVYFDPRLPSANDVAFQSDSEPDEDGQGGNLVAPQRPRRPSNGDDDEDEIVSTESERMPVFGLESRGAAAAFEHAAGLQRQRHILAAPVSDRTLPRSQNDGSGSEARETLVGIFERDTVGARSRDNNTTYAQLAAVSRVSGCQPATCRSGPCASPQPVLLATGDANEVDPTCNICYSALVSRQLTCGHRLCELCVCRWRAAGHDTCPFCRARIDAARVKEVGVLKYPGRVPMDPVGEAFMRFVAHRVTVPSDRPWCKPRRTITVTEKAGVVIEPDWDNLAGIFPNRATSFTPRKRTGPLATTSKIAGDTKSETETPGGSDGSGPTDTVYDSATVSEEVRSEDGRPPTDRKARERGSIAVGSKRRTKHRQPRMRRSSGTSDLYCEHLDRCSPEAAVNNPSAPSAKPSANGVDGNEATEQDGAGHPEPLGDVSVARAYDALVGRRWDHLLQVVHPQPPSPQVTARRGATKPELHFLGPDDV